MAAPGGGAPGAVRGLIGSFRSPGSITLSAPRALLFLLFLLFWNPKASLARSINRKNSKNSKG